jgi:hypothetical protein
VFPYHYMGNEGGEFLKDIKLYMNAAGNILFAE